MLTEGFGKIGDAFKTGLVGRLRHGDSGLLQKLSGAVDADVTDVADGFLQEYFVERIQRFGRVVGRGDHLLAVFLPQQPG